MIDKRDWRLLWREGHSDSDDISDSCLSPHLTLGDKEPQADTEAAAAPSLTIITHFTQKLVEKLYSGAFSADPRHILLFITEHIMVVRTLLAMVVWKWPTECLSDMLLAIEVIQIGL